MAEGDRKMNAVRKARFIEALGETHGTVTAACRIAGISKQTAYDARKEDPEFAEAWAEAVDYVGDVLEQTAFQRAVQGWEEPVYQGGNLVGTIRKYSDKLLEICLKGARPEKYRERISTDSRIEVTSGVLAVAATATDTADWLKSADGDGDGKD